MSKDDVRKHFEGIAYSYDNYKEKNSYYYQYLKKILFELNQKFNYNSVLDIGCGTGELLNFLKPDRGVGIDISKEMISIGKEKFKEYEFIASDIDGLKTNEKFDLIILIDIIEHLTNLKTTLSKVKELSSKNTRIIISSPSYYWSPILFVGEKMKMKMEEGSHRWIPPNLLKKIIEEDFRVVCSGYRLIIPKRIPFFSDLINSIFHKLPLLRRLGLIYYLVIERK